MGRSAFSLLARSWPDVSAPLILRDRAAVGELPPDLYVVPGPWPRLGRPVKHEVATWRVIDDWPARVPAPFDVVIVHSFSRFFRDHFELEFYVRKLAKNGVRLVSITQEMGDDPMHVMMRQIMALFDEYQSKENAKHVLRALKENAR